MELKDFGFLHEHHQLKALCAELTRLEPGPDFDRCFRVLVELLYRAGHTDGVDEVINTLRDKFHISLVGRLVPRTYHRG